MLSWFNAAIIGQTDVKLDIGDFSKICPEISHLVKIGQKRRIFQIHTKVALFRRCLQLKPSLKSPLSLKCYEAVRIDEEVETYVEYSTVLCYTYNRAPVRYRVLAETGIFAICPFLSYRVG